MVSSPLLLLIRQDPQTQHVCVALTFRKEDLLTELANEKAVTLKGPLMEGHSLLQPSNDTLDKHLRRPQCQRPDPVIKPHGKQKQQEGALTELVFAAAAAGDVWDVFSCVSSLRDQPAWACGLADLHTRQSEGSRDEMRLLEQL